MSKAIKRIFLWSSPRNISTTLMYSFAQRADTHVHDEPLYGHYLKSTNAHEYHPGAEEIMASMECNGNKVIDMMQSVNDRPVQFFKNMGHHLLDLDRAFTKNGVNIILMRDPRQMIVSFSKVIKKPTMKDIGYRDQLELANYFESNGIPFVVIESSAILKDPETKLKELCELIGIPFDPRMLHWEPGPRPEDGIWSKYWYENIHNSSGFLPYKESTVKLDDNLYDLYKEAQSYYNALLRIN